MYLQDVLLEQSALQFSLYTHRYPTNNSQLRHYRQPSRQALIVFLPQWFESKGMHRSLPQTPRHP